MEITSPPRIAMPSAVPARLEPPRDAVPTELGARLSVDAVGQAASPIAAGRQAGTPASEAAAALARAVDRHLSVDPTTRLVVYRAVERRTGEVLQQTPTEDSLKLRMYLQQTEEMQAERRAANGEDNGYRVHRIA